MIKLQELEKTTTHAKKSPSRYGEKLNKTFWA